MSLTKKKYLFCEKEGKKTCRRKTKKKVMDRGGWQVSIEVVWAVIVVARNTGKRVVCLVFGGSTVQGGSDGGGSDRNWEAVIKPVGIEDLLGPHEI